MSLEEFKNKDATAIPVCKSIAMIAKGFAIYVNHQLEEYEINATQLNLLFEISNQENPNQEKIASMCNINKGAVARSIKKLEDKHLIVRQIDENNRRQNKLSLTQKGNETLTKAMKILDKWENEVILDDGFVERELLQKILKEIAIKTMELNEREE